MKHYQNRRGVAIASVYPENTAAAALSTVVKTYSDFRSTLRDMASLIPVPSGCAIAVETFSIPDPAESETVRTRLRSHRQALFYNLFSPGIAPSRIPGFLRDSANDRTADPTQEAKAKVCVGGQHGTRPALGCRAGRIRPKVSCRATTTGLGPDQLACMRSMTPCSAAASLAGSRRSPSRLRLSDDPISKRPPMGLIPTPSSGSPTHRPSPA